MDADGASAWAAGVALAAIALSVALASWVLVEGSSEVVRATSAPPVRAETTDRPAVPLGRDRSALMLAQHNRDLLLGLAARRGGPIELITIPGRAPVEAVTATIDGRPLAPTSCGTQCYRLQVAAMEGTPLALAVRVRRVGGATAAFRFRLPRQLPKPGAELFRAANRRMQALRAVEFVETLSSGFAVVRTRYRMRAPDRLSLHTSAGQQAIIIGARRWDREEDGRWTEAPFPATRYPTYAWEGAGHAHILGKTELDGVPVDVLAVFDQENIPIWFRLYVTRDRRVLRAEMLAASHFMTHEFRAFDGPIRIEKPA